MSVGVGGDKISSSLQLTNCLVTDGVCAPECYFPPNGQSISRFSSSLLCFIVRSVKLTPTHSESGPEQFGKNYRWGEARRRSWFTFPTDARLGQVCLTAPDLAGKNNGSSRAFQKGSLLSCAHIGRRQMGQSACVCASLHVDVVTRGKTYVVTYRTVQWFVQLCLTPINIQKGCKSIECFCVGVCGHSR